MANSGKKMWRYQSMTMVGLLLIVSLATACVKTKTVTKEDGEKEVVADLGEGPTRGNIKIGIDESLNPVLQQEVETFMMLYREATLNPTVAPEGALIEQLMDDSLRVIVIGRELTEAERRHIVNSQVQPRQTLIGQGAIALVCHPDNPVDSLTEEQLGSILRGDIRNWKDLGGKDQSISIVFDHPLSGVLQYAVKRFIGEGDTLPPNSYTAESTGKVIDYVHNATNALGLIGYSWIADRDSPEAKEFLEKTTLMKMQCPPESDMPGKWVRPYQSEIKMNRWPLTRPIYAVSREHFSGLGTGFVIFLGAQEGQSILLKAGLLPEFPPPREVILPPLNQEDN